jgi:hypothetical protein
MASSHGHDHSRPTSSGDPLTIQRVKPYEAAGIAITSDALDAEGRIDDRYSAYFDDLVPPLAWSRVLEAQTWALVVEDPDAPMEHPFIHWMMWNIPGGTDHLAAGLSREAHPPELPGAVQGLNSAGTHGWHGARPPEGDGPHHYHFQLFALAAPLNHLSPEASLEELVTALKGLTIAEGEIVGTYERRDPLEASSARADERGGLDEDDVDRHAPHDPSGEVSPRVAHAARPDGGG